jgi:hypothetical protein
MTYTIFNEAEGREIMKTTDQTQFIDRVKSIAVESEHTPVIDSVLDAIDYILDYHIDLNVIVK